MARYQSTQLVKPISTYAPAPLKYIDEAGAANQLQTDQGNAYVEGIQALFPKGGAQTQNMAQQFKTDYIPEVEKLANDLYTNGKITGGASKILELRNRIMNDPRYSGLKKDEEMIPVAQKIASDQTTLDPNLTIQNALNSNGTWNQKTVDDLKNQDTWYNQQKNVNFLDDHKDFYSALKPQLTKVGSVVPGITYKEDGNGDLVAFNTSTQEAHKGILPEDVANIANNYTKDQTNWDTHKSVQFRQAKGQYDQSDYVNDLVNNYPGYYSEDASMQSEQRIPDNKVGGTKGSGRSGSGQGSEGTPNRFGDIINNIDKRGETVASGADMAGMLNGAYDKNTNTFDVNMSDAPNYIHIAKNSNNKESSINSIKINKFIPLKNQENSIIKRIEDDKKISISNTINGRGQTPIVDSKGNSYNLGSTGDYQVTYKNGSKKSLSQSEFENSDYYKEELNKELNKDPEYQNLQKTANSEGIDLEDKKLNNDVLKIDPNSKELITDFNIALSNFSGTMKISPGTGNNTFSDDQGNMFIRGNAKISEDQMQSIASSTDGVDLWGLIKKGYKKLESQGLIKKYTDDKGQSWYDVPIIRPVTNDSDNVTDHIQQNNYGQDKYVINDITEHQATNRDLLDKIKIKKQAVSFGVQYDKDPSILDKEYNDIISGKRGDTGFTDEELNKLNETKVQAMQMPDKTTQQKNAKKEALFQIHLYLKDPQGFQKMYNGQENIQESNSDLGVRNLNPGNLRDSNGEFKKFNTLNEGYSAMISDLSSKINGSSNVMISKYGKNYLEDSTLQDMLHVYAPSTDNNDPVKYAQTVADSLGVKRNTLLKNIDPKKLAQAMIKVESPSSYNALFSQN